MEPILPTTSHIELNADECALLIVSLDKLSITGTIGEAQSLLNALALAAQLREKIHQVYTQIK